MSIMENWNIWFQGHNNCDPRKWLDKPRGFTMRDFDRSSFIMLSELEGVVHAMAGKQNSKASDWGNIEFVNVTLNEAQRKEFKAWYTTHVETLVDTIGQIMVDHHRLSCNWDDNNQCFIATLTGKQDSRFNSSKALSARSDDWYEAIALVVFKYVVIFNSQTWNGETTKNNWG